MVTINQSRKKIIIILIIFGHIISRVFPYDDYFDIKFDKSIKVEMVSNKLCQNPNKPGEFYFMEWNLLKYYDDSINLLILSVINSEKSNLLYKLAKNNKIKLEYAANSSWIEARWTESIPFIINNDIVIKEYIRDTATEYYTDYFDFIVKKNDVNESIVLMDIQFINAYSTFVDKRENRNLTWNRELIEEYEDQNNPGIKFYYLVEDAIKNISIKNPSLEIKGTLNDDKVRLRSENNLSCKTIRLMRKGEEVQVIDCLTNTEEINGKKSPWIKVITKNNETGYIYGEYLDVYVKLER